jgi:hypothetical protein
VAESNDYKDEIDADGKAQQFVIRTAAERLGVQSSDAHSPPPITGAARITGQQMGETPAPLVSGDSVTPKYFLDQKRPKTDPERVACLAFYLTHHRATPHFKTADISAMNTDAAQSAFSNASYATKVAESKGFIAPAAKRGQKQISAFGEKFVDALPDRDAVNAVVEENRKRHRKGKGKKKTGKKPS